MNYHFECNNTFVKVDLDVQRDIVLPVQFLKFCLISRRGGWYLVCVDYSKAFVTIDHNILLETLSSYKTLIVIV